MAVPQLRLLATAAHLVGRKSVPFCQLRRRKASYSRCLHAAAQGASWSPSHPRGHRATQCCGAGAQWWLLAGMHGPQLSVGSKFGSFTALSLCNGRAAEQESCQQRCGCAVPMPTDHHKYKTACRNVWHLPSPVSLQRRRGSYSQEGSTNRCMREVGLAGLSRGCTNTSA